MDRQQRQSTSQLPTIICIITNWYCERKIIVVISSCHYSPSPSHPPTLSTPIIRIIYQYTVKATKQHNVGQTMFARRLRVVRPKKRIADNADTD